MANYWKDIAQSQSVAIAERDKQAVELNRLLNFYRALSLCLATVMVIAMLVAG